MDCPGGDLFQSGPAIPVMFCLRDRRQGSSNPYSYGCQRLATVWCWLLTFLCPGGGPIVTQTTAAITAAVRTAPAKGLSLSMLRARSYMMLQLAHLLQASQAEIPI